MTTTDHILRNTQATLEIVFTSGDAAGAVTYAVTDAEGTSVASGTATNETEPGRYTFVLAPQSAVKSLTVAWTGTWSGAVQTITTYAEVVGGHLFTLAEARAFDKAALSNTTTYPDTTILEARAGIADFFMRVTDISFIPRYGRDLLDDAWGYDLWLTKRGVRSLLAVTVDGTVLTAPELADLEVYDAGYVYRQSGWSTTSGRRSIVVSYEHGYAAVPFDAHQEALTYLRYLLVPTDVSDRTVSYSNELGTFRNAVPGMKYPTGIPSVDAMLARHTTPVLV